MAVNPPSTSGIGRRREAAATEGTDAYRVRYDELVRAAARVFKEKGYGRATVGDIAREMGTDRATVYYYVPNKASLFRLAVHQKLLENTDHIESIASGTASPAHKLRMAVQGLMTSFHESYPALYIYVQEDLKRLDTDDDEWALEMKQLGRRYDAAMVRIIEQGLADQSLRSSLPPKAIAYSIIGMLNWSYRWFHEDGAMTGAEIGDALADLVLIGISSSEPARRVTPSRNRR